MFVLLFFFPPLSGLSVSENAVTGCARGKKASGVLGAAEEEVRALLLLSWDVCWKPPPLPTDFLALAEVREHPSFWLWDFPAVRKREKRA